MRSREQHGREARPALNYIDQAARDEGEALKQKLQSIAPGREQATEYQRLVLEILNFLFSPELIDGQPEVKTIDGTERRDIIFTNDSDESFWEYVRSEHAAILVMFEAKNVAALDVAAINQTATYLGDRIGRLGVIVTRASVPESVQRKAFTVWNDSAPNRKVILILTDDHAPRVARGARQRRLAHAVASASLPSISNSTSVAPHRSSVPSGGPKAFLAYFLAGSFDTRGEALSLSRLFQGVRHL